jgi:hypothetical protein
MIIIDVNIISYGEKIFIKGVRNELLINNLPSAFKDSIAAMLAFLGVSKFPNLLSSMLF